MKTAVPRSPWSRTEYLDNFAKVTKQMLEITAKNECVKRVSHFVAR